jgi:two-component system NtrC family sensor kinase
LPTLVILPLLLGVTIVRWNAKFDATLISKVNGDLTIAHQYLARILENTGEKVQALGASARFRDSVAGPVAGRVGDPNAMDLLLERSRTALGFDFLFVIDAGRKIQASAREHSATTPKTDWPIVASALAGVPSTAIDIFANEELADVAPELAERARIDLVPTPNAVPTDRTQETRGMVVHSASPVTLADGRSAALVGGILLNQNLVFIDTINDLVYREASLPEGSQGTATLFLDDVRISTNVRLFEGRRALGTRVSTAVRSTVLDNGRTWLDSAFVVNDWYISASEPIVDSFGKRVGMLYVGFLEAPFTAAKYQTLLLITLAFLAITAASIPIFLRWARAIFQPLERMTGQIGRASWRERV